MLPVQVPELHWVGPVHVQKCWQVSPAWHVALRRHAAFPCALHCPRASVLHEPLEQLALLVQVALEQTPDVAFLQVPPPALVQSAFR